MTIRLCKTKKKKKLNGLSFHLFLYIIFFQSVRLDLFLKIDILYIMQILKKKKLYKNSKPL